MPAPYPLFGMTSTIALRTHRTCSASDAAQSRGRHPGRRTACEGASVAWAHEARAAAGLVGERAVVGQRLRPARFAGAEPLEERHAGPEHLGVGGTEVAAHVAHGAAVGDGVGAQLE